MIPGEILPAEGTIVLNEGRPTTRLRVANRGDRPVQIGSHYHFAEVNDALVFNRYAARGQRLDIPAGTSVRFEPGQERDVTLIPYGGDGIVRGFRGQKYIDTVKVERLLVLDQNTDNDPASQIVHRQRRLLLFPQLTASRFNNVITRVFERDMVPAKVKAQLESFASGYVTAGGHGFRQYLAGWYLQGSTEDYEQVIAVSGPGACSYQGATGKIFHFFACHCGYMGTHEKPGLGRTLVARGAVAFFGYNDKYALSPSYEREFCEPDIAIDLALLAGRSCAEAHAEALACFNANIDQFRKEGNFAEASVLEYDRNLLVSPVTDPMYGNPRARLVPLANAEPAAPDA